jgi:hypothetical protein
MAARFGGACFPGAVAGAGAMGLGCTAQWGWK